MRINSHCHIFNLQSVFTEETLDILLRRIADIAMPDGFKTKLNELLVRSIVQAAECPQVETLIDDFVKQAALGEHMGTLAGSKGLKVDLIGSDLLGKAGAELISRWLKSMARVTGSAVKDARNQFTLTDLLDFLIVGLKPSIAAVTANIMEQLDPADVLVALMMDITNGNGNDEKLFDRQIADTSDQVLRYPGRILPFFAVNPLRRDFRARMEKALNAQGFAGIKLYPSLGYDIGSDEIRDVLQYCHCREIPIMVHGSPGGFYARKEDQKRCEPKLWKPFLKKYPGLKVCFGHFGGSENLCVRTIRARTWTQQIIDMMNVPENTGVFADVSFHSDPMRSGDQERFYFSHLRKLLKDPVVGDRILFGTDFWLVRMVLTESNHWRYFEQALGSPDLFVKATLTNARQFLGIGEHPGRSAPNIRNYIRFVMENHSIADGPGAAQWLQDEIRTAGGPDMQSSTGAGLRWMPNNEAHVRMYRYLKANQMHPQDAETLRFEDCAFFPVARLQYWNKEFESASIFLGKCEAVAKGLDRYFRKNQAENEAGVDRENAIQKLIGALADKGTVFSDLARDCDALYRFKTELS